MQKRMDEMSDLELLQALAIQYQTLIQSQGNISAIDREVSRRQTMVKPVPQDIDPEDEHEA